MKYKIYYEEIIMRKPYIGITIDLEYEKDRFVLNSRYVEAIQAVEGIPVLIPFCRDEEVSAYMNRVDGVLLTGGDDIDGRYFNEPTYRFAGKIIPQRDQQEICIAKICLQENIPILGICRGMQIMAIAAGGSIYQDIEKQYAKLPLIKHKQEAPRWYGSHRVHIVNASKLGAIVRKEFIYVNSFHHQGIREIGDSMIISARSEDQLIEGFEDQNHRFYLGVQWHPEHMYEKDMEQKRIFQNLILAAREYRGE